MRPSFCFDFALQTTRGRRESRMRAAPAVSCAIRTRNCAHEHTGPAESIRPSLRNGLTAYGALSPETNSFCLRHRRIDGFANPVGPRENLRRFDTSHGCQNHTLLPYARTPLVLRGSIAHSLKRSLTPPCNASRARAPHVHRSPHSTYRDDAYAPLR
jgi:hypothetical protein